MAETGIQGGSKQQLKVVPSKAVPCVSGPSAQEQHRALAALAISPSLAAQRVIEASQPPGIREELDTPSLLDELVEQARSLGGGRYEPTRGHADQSSIRPPEPVCGPHTACFSPAFITVFSGAHAAWVEGSEPVQEHASSPGCAQGTAIDLRPAGECHVWAAADQ